MNYIIKFSIFLVLHCFQNFFYKFKNTAQKRIIKNLNLFMRNDFSKKESESFEHLRIKQFILDNIPLNNNLISIDFEEVIGNRIADVCVILSNGKKIVIEIQHSKITSEEIIQRTRDYNTMGYHVLWILDGATYERIPMLENGIRVSSVEKCLHEMFIGRVYYLSASKTGIQETVFPLHFTAYQEQKILSQRFEYYRKSKTKKSLIPGIFSSYELITFQHKGFKLARFTDENVKSKCIEEISQFLKDSPKLLDGTKKIGKELSQEERLVFLTIALFSSRYGLHLLFNILKALKIVNHIKFSFLIAVQKYLVSNLNKSLN